MFSKFNRIFLKWNFFFKKYDQLMYRNFKGFYIDEKKLDLKYLDKLKEKKDMIFWLLDLQQQGAKKVLNRSNTFLDIHWSLTQGEKNFLELYGYLNTPLEFNDNKSHLLFPMNKETLFLENALLYLNEQGFFIHSDIHEQKQLLKFFKIAVTSTSTSKKTDILISIPEAVLFSKKKSPNNIHPYIKNKEAFLSDAFQKNIFTLDYTSYDNLLNYINIFKFEYGVGREFSDIYIDFLNQSNYQGRFKNLPTIVPSLDKPISLEQGLGYQTFFQTFRNEELSLFLQYQEYCNTIASSYNNREKDFCLINNNFMTTWSSSEPFNSIIEKYSCYDVFFLTKTVAFNDNLIFKNGGVLDYNRFLNYFQLYVDCENILYISNTKSIQYKQNKLKFIRLFFVFWFFYDRLLAVDLKDCFTTFLKQSYLSTNFSRVNALYDKQENLYQIYSRILNFFHWKKFYKNVYYSYVNTQEYTLLQNWLLKIKELFLLKMDIGRNNGFILDKLQLDGNMEDEDLFLASLDDNYNLSDLKYKLFMNDIYQPYLTNPGNRPYKWLSISELQISPFMSFFSNIKSFWFLLYNSFPNFTKFNHNTLNFTLSNSQKLDALLNFISKLMFLTRYIYSNDNAYNILLKYYMSPLFISNLFGKKGFWHAKFSFFVDFSLTRRSFFSQKNLFHQNLFKLTSMPRMLNTLSYDIRDMWTFLEQNSFFDKDVYGSDWTMNTEKRLTDMFRLSLIYKMGFSNSHFNFFAFMSPEFFERAVIYQGWMKYRTLDKVPDPEHPLLILDFYRPHTFELTSDITLLKYKMDLLFLTRLGFDDVVFDKDIFLDNFYQQATEKRDVLKMPEYSAPFFFFDSDLNAMTSVPVTPIYERISAFGIPALDQQWRFIEFLVPKDSDFEELWTKISNEGTSLSGSQKKKIVVDTLWKHDKESFIFMAKELQNFQKWQDSLQGQDPGLFVLKSQVHDNSFLQIQKIKSLNKKYSILYKKFRGLNSITIMRLKKELIYKILQKSFKFSIKASNLIRSFVIYFSNKPFFNAKLTFLLEIAVYINFFGKFLYFFILFYYHFKNYLDSSLKVISFLRDVTLFFKIKQYIFFQLKDVVLLQNDISLKRYIHRLFFFNLNVVLDVPQKEKKYFEFISVLFVIIIMDNNNNK